MRSNRDLAQDVLAELLDVTSAEKILEYLVVNYLPGTVALEGLKEYKSELFGDDEEEDEEEELEVGMEVEVILKGDACINEVGDIGTITMIDDQGSFRVSVDGRDGPNNWMNASQVARINY